MSSDNPVFLDWEERIISQEKGNRIVHYYLKHFSGDSVLAVVGTERSIRHMIYVVSDDLLNAYESMRIATPGTKWRAKREVVEWLTEVVSKYRQSNSQAAVPTESPKASESSAGGTGTNQESEMAPRKVQVQGSDIVWLGDAWICNKQLKHYPAFSRNGVNISVYSFAYVMGEGGARYVAYLDDLYEDKKGLKNVKVRWFHHNQEVKNLIPQLNADPGEVFITPHEQVISAECIDGVALVLTPKDFEKYLTHNPEGFSSGVHMCHREFRNNKVKLFSLSKMRGYSNQLAVSHHVPEHKKATADKSNEEVEDCSHKDLVRQGAKKARSFKGNRKSESDQIRKCEPTHQKLRIKLSSKGAVGIKLVGPEPQCQASLKVGDNIEVLSQDSGMRGCWFRCKILQASEKRLKVQHYDVDDVDGPRKLEEWVPASRVAAPDKLGMRHAGRLTVRPWPLKDSSDYPLQIGAAVDAWWCDGWWEGVIIGVDTSGRDSIQVYFPGENKMMSFEKNYTRISRDWIDDKWVEVKVKHDIFSSLSSIMSAKPKPPTSSHSVKASDSALGDSKIFTPPKFGASQHGKQVVPDPVLSDRTKSVEGLNLKKKLSIKDGEEKFHGGSGGSNSGGVSGGKVSEV